MSTWADVDRYFLAQLRRDGWEVEKMGDGWEAIKDGPGNVWAPTIRDLVRKACELEALHRKERRPSP